MKILVAPQKVGTSMVHNFESVGKIKAHVTGATEMDLGQRTFIGLAEQVLGRGYTSVAKDYKQHSQEVPLFVRTSPFCRILDHDTFFLSRNIPGPGVGNDRWVNYLHLKWFTKEWAIYMTHLNARVQDLQTGDAHDINNERVMAYAKSITRLEGFVEDSMRDPKIGKRVVVMGDFNMLPIGDGLSWQYSPHMMFDRLGMKYVNTRVIYLAWGKGVNMRSNSVIPAHSAWNMSDHGWILGKVGAR